MTDSLDVLVPRFTVLEPVVGLLYVVVGLVVPVTGFLFTDALELTVILSPDDAAVPTGDLLTVVIEPREADVPFTFVAVVLPATVLPADTPLLVLFTVVLPAIVPESRPTVDLTLEPPLSEELPAKTLLEPVSYL